MVYMSERAASLCASAVAGCSGSDQSSAWIDHQQQRRFVFVSHLRLHLLHTLLLRNDIILCGRHDEVRDRMTDAEGEGEGRW